MDGWWFSITKWSRTTGWLACTIAELEGESIGWQRDTVVVLENENNFDWVPDDLLPLTDEKKLGWMSDAVAVLEDVAFEKECCFWERKQIWLICWVWCGT